MNEHEHMHEMLARRTELSVPEEAALRQHLEGCPDCRERAAIYAQQTLLLRSLPEVAPPAALRSGVLRGIRQPSPRRWAMPRFVLAAPAAALALAVVVALALTHRPSGAPSHSALATVAVTPPRTGPGPSPVTVKRKEHRTGRRFSGRKHARHGAPLPTVAPGPPPIVALGQQPSGQTASQPAATAHAPTATTGPAASTPAIGSYPPQVSGHRTPPPATEVATTPVVVIGTRPATRTPVPTAVAGTPTPVPVPSQVGVAAQPATPSPTAAVPPAPTTPPTSTATPAATPLP